MKFLRREIASLNVHENYLFRFTPGIEDYGVFPSKYYFLRIINIVMYALIRHFTTM